MKRLYKKPGYTQLFDTKSGLHVYFGNKEEENPTFCAYGPSILDIEISSGKCFGNCKFCYKSNGINNDDINNMSLEVFNKILSKIDKKLLTQVAFGLCDIDSNLSMWDMFKSCRKYNIIPNYTNNGLGITDEHARLSAELCGAVAVSIVNKEQSFNAIEKFCNAGMTQVNIHFMLAQETYDSALLLLEEIKSDPRLAKMNAVVFLQYKPKGNGVGHFHPIASVDLYQQLIEKASSLGVRVGFDSCSAPMYLKYLAKTQTDEKYKALSMYADPCESLLFSGYINGEGKFFPCSFAEGEGKWTEGIDVLACDDFLKVWHHERSIEWRRALIDSSSDCKCKCSAGCRNCPLYDITPCKNGY
jgi:hypothetical protein